MKIDNKKDSLLIEVFIKASIFFSTIPFIYYMGGDMKKGGLLLIEVFMEVSILF